MPSWQETEAMIQAAVDAERAACAKIADEYAAETEMELEGVSNYDPTNTARLMAKGNAMAQAQMIAAAIRNRQ